MVIVYCVNTLAFWGGLEIVTVAKANALAQNPEYSIWIVTCCDDSHRTCTPVSDKVGIIGMKNEMSKGFPWNILQWFFKKRSIKKSFLQILSQINPDIVISTGGFDKWIVPSVKGEWARIREIHYIKNYREQDNGPVMVRIAAFLAEQVDYLFSIKRFDRVVVLTQEDKRVNWNNNEIVSVIPNPARFKQGRVSLLDEKSIIAVGRLTHSKNFLSLLRVFSSVNDRFPEWTLDIYGEGEERDSLLAQIDSLGLFSSVRLMGNVVDIQERMLNYSILVCSSLHEGFGMAIVEAMSCGLPVVSYACPYGPGEIITDGTDGFLVPVGDENALAERICRLIENDNLRKSMGAAAYERSKDFSIERITGLWMDLFQDLLKRKRE